MDNSEILKSMTVIQPDDRLGTVRLTRRRLQRVHDGLLDAVNVIGSDGLEREFKIADLRDARPEGVCECPDCHGEK